MINLFQLFKEALLKGKMKKNKKNLLMNLMMNKQNLRMIRILQERHYLMMIK